MVTGFMFGLHLHLSFKFHITLFNNKNSVQKKKKIYSKFGTLDSKKTSFAKSQVTVKDILSNASNI